MRLYLTRFSYTPATWARLIDKPEDRRLAAQQYIESVVGNLRGAEILLLRGVAESADAMFGSL